ncbi:hypothetical protein H0H92_002867 [Tricholoma furcatifolium]|nr:hypothetical protein H0H92_002867 [Tricholoma furcatifolium]
MAMNLAHQVCSITQVTKAIAGSDLTKTIEVDGLTLYEHIRAVKSSTSIQVFESGKILFPSSHVEMLKILLRTKLRSRIGEGRRKGNDLAQRGQFEAGLDWGALLSEEIMPPVDALTQDDCNSWNQ